MILEYYFPEEKFTWEELDKLSGKKEGLWTWPLKTMIHLKDRGLQVINREYFDYERFSREGDSYLIGRFGEEVGRSQIENSDIPSEMENAKRILTDIDLELRVPGFSDIRELLNEGFLVVCNVNLHALNGDPGYSGHFVLIIGIDDGSLYMHDPGPPPVKNRKVSHGQFLKAWAYPSDKDKNMIAFKYEEQEHDLIKK